jgi:hypothetical protein
MPREITPKMDRSWTELVWDSARVKARPCRLVGASLSILTNVESGMLFDVVIEEAVAVGSSAEAETPSVQPYMVIVRSSFAKRTGFTFECD